MSGSQFFSDSCDVSGQLDMNQIRRTMADDREQLERVVESVGGGSNRRVRLTVLAFLAVSGIILQALAWWYRVQAIREEWAAAAVQVWPFAIGIWILTMGVALALLWKRRKDMQKGPMSEGET